MPARSHRDEKALNQALSTALQTFLRGAGATVEAERSGTLTKGGQPDMTVDTPGRERVLVENKYDTAANRQALEDQCRERLDVTWTDTGDRVRIAVAVLSPRQTLDRIEDAELVPALQDGTIRLHWSAWIRNGHAEPERLPSEGWLSGTVRELAGCLDRVGSEARADSGMTAYLQDTLAQAANIAGCPQGFADLLEQEPGEQTSRMAAAVLFNASLMQAAVAVHHPEVPPPARMVAEGNVRQSSVLDAWKTVLCINYYPIFGVALKLLLAMPNPVSADRLVKRLFEAVGRMAGDPHARSLAGRIFGALIADRKLLATFYTLPAPAAMLAEMAVSALPAIDWSAPKVVGSLSIADFACGTGSLLVAVYRRLAERHLLAGGNPRKLHKTLMENVLIGSDVMPAAVHLTAARLAGEHPDIDYTETQTYVLPYGVVDGTARLGSLDLLHRDRQPALFGDGSIVTTSQGENPEAWMKVPARSLDMVIMNPPFTRSTSHEGTTAAVPRAAWAAFNQSEHEQKQCTDAWKKLEKRITWDKASNGQVGLATYFVDLAHAKLKEGGVLALIVPAAIVSGKDWESTRSLLADYYRSVRILTLSAAGAGTQAFSADTGMAEAVVLAVRSDDGTETARHFVLDGRPNSEFMAVETALSVASVRPEYDGIRLGLATVGRAFNLPFGADTSGNPSGVQDPSVARTVLNLKNGRIDMPRLGYGLDLAMTSLSELGYRGTLHRDLTGSNKKEGTPRGPFEKEDVPSRNTYEVDDYPCLWGHDRRFETQMQVLPDSACFVRPGMDGMAMDRWNGYNLQDGTPVAGATRLHISLGFRLTSQPLGACLTPVPALGGSGWATFLPTPEGGNACTWERCLAVWLNCTLGLAVRWWVSSRQQQGRAILTVTTLGLIPRTRLARA